MQRLYLNVVLANDVHVVGCMLYVTEGAKCMHALQEAAAKTIK